MNLDLTILILDKIKKIPYFILFKMRTGTGVFHLYLQFKFPSKRK